jgi:hypothetical protein
VILFIPKRPDDPADYYDEAEEEEAKEEDADDNDGSIGAPNREDRHPFRSERDGDDELNQGLNMSCRPEHGLRTNLG